MNRLDGKVALISGAARGIGGETARLMVEAGATVAIGDVLDERGRETARALGDAALYVHLDVTSEEDWTTAVAAALARFGKLDILVNNAGLFLGKDIEAASLAEWERLCAVNLTGVFLGTKLCLPALREAAQQSVKAPTLPPSRRARARARVSGENQRPWPADKVERWAIDRLIPYAKNARTHTDAQVAAIAASIKEWGWTTPALVGEDGGLIAGHARILAARQLGIAEIPVMVAAGWTEAQKRAYVLADNQLAITGSGWDPELLRLELGELKVAYRVRRP